MGRAASEAERLFERSVVGIIDDQPYFARIMRTVLLCFGVREVHPFTEPEHLFEAVRAADVDVVFADLLMPGFDGLDLVRAIRSDPFSANRGLPIICVSADSRIERVKEAVLAGADDFLVKPVRPIDVYRCLMNVVTDPLSRIPTPTYFGPDRRRGLPNTWRGADRRTEDLTVESDAPAYSMLPLHR